MHGRQLQLPERPLERRDAASAQALGQPPPDAGPVVELADLPEHPCLVGMQGHVEAALPDLGHGAQVLETGPLLAERDPAVVRAAVGEAQPIGERPPDEPLRPVVVLDRVRGRLADPAGRVAVPVVVHDERPRRPGAVGVREHVLVDATRVVLEVVEQEVGGLGEVAAPVEDRDDLALVARDEPLVHGLLHRRPPELHAVLLGEALELAVPEHRQARAAWRGASRRRCTCRPCRTARPRSSRPGCS